MHQRRSYGRILLVSVLVGYLEVALAVVALLLYTRTQPVSGIPFDWGALAAALFPFGTLVGVIAFLLSLLFVLPTVLLAGLLARRVGGREWWWVPPVMAALLALPLAVWAGENAPRAGDVPAFWAGATASLSLGALIARSRRSALFRRVALGGVAVVAGTGLLGALGLATGLLPTYRPPAIGPQTMTGTWVDHRGGKLVFTSDGRVTASDIGEHEPFDHPSGPSHQCTGSGTWSYEPGRDVWTQKVRVEIAGCSWPAPWSVGGTGRKPWIQQTVGDPASGKVYELRKATGGS
ncbi:hypothetical protein [Streptomyces sp. NPDC001717]|uniref:hypothetical protein n=1 Tax=Streptomyces sp. NPDC001717 TaxID=3364604 RepID=UPI0036CCF38E